MLIGPGVLVIIMGSWLGGIMLIHPRSGPLVLLPALGTMAAVLPGLVSYLRTWKHLAKLGYGSVRRGQDRSEGVMSHLLP